MFDTAIQDAESVIPKLIRYSEDCADEATDESATRTPEERKHLAEAAELLARAAVHATVIAKEAIGVRAQAVALELQENAVRHQFAAQHLGIGGRG